MNPYLSVVNERLLFGKLLLQQVGADTSPHLARALCQSALLQLEMGYRQHLREIASNYHCKNVDTIRDVDSLKAALEMADKHPGEASEMADLEKRANSWLRELLSGSRRLREGSVNPSGDSRAKLAGNLIPLQHLGDGETVIAELNPDRVSGWYAALQEMIERHRETMFEC